MYVVMNRLHAQVPGAIDFISDLVVEGEPTAIEFADSLEDATTCVNDYGYREGIVVLLGFIYKEVVPEVYNDYDVFYVSDIGVLPNYLKVPMEGRHYSLIHQLIIALQQERKHIKNLDTTLLEANQVTIELLNPGTSKSYKEHLDYNELILLDLLKDRCYNKGNVYMMYENNPMLKGALADSILWDLDKGIVIIGSQTRSNNDILTFYVKGYDTTKIAKAFDKQPPKGSNVFSVFVPSHINILGNQITKFMEAL